MNTKKRVLNTYKAGTKLPPDLADDPWVRVVLQLGGCVMSLEDLPTPKPPVKPKERKEHKP